MNADLKVAERFDDAFISGVRPLIENLAAGYQDITVDMTSTEQVDAAGLHALIYMQRNLAPLGYKVRVVGASDRVKHLFEIFHIADLFLEKSLH